MYAALPQTPSAERVYHAKWPPRRRWAVLLYLFCGALQIIRGIERHDWWSMILGSWSLAMIPLTMSGWRNPRLVVTPDGITYHSGGAVLDVPWQDMEYIGRNPRRGWYHDYDGIVLQIAEWKSPRWLPWTGGWQRQSIIPLWSRWTGPWWDRELFDDIFFYAPWLAGEG